LLARIMEVMDIAKKRGRLVERRTVLCHSPSSGSEDRHRLRSLAVCHARLHPISLADRGRPLDHPILPCSHVGLSVRLPRISEVIHGRRLDGESADRLERPIPSGRPRVGEILAPGRRLRGDDRLAYGNPARARHGGMRRCQPSATLHGLQTSDRIAAHDSDPAAEMCRPPKDASDLSWRSMESENAA
jgi:hypothetical protein